MKKLFLNLVLASTLALGTQLVAADKQGNAQSTDTAPKTVIHVVTVGWKEGTTEEQIQAAIDGVKRLPSQYPGILRVWTKALNVQNPGELKVRKTHAFVMEFASEQALKDYSNSPAQQEWYKAYLPIRQQSTTHDITN